MQEAHVSPIDFRLGSMRLFVSIVLTRSHNTRRARIHSTPKESVVTIVSSRVMVVRLNLSSTRRCVLSALPTLQPFTEAHDLQAKTTKKVVLRLECTVCKYKAQLALKRCKQYVPRNPRQIVVWFSPIYLASSWVARKRQRVLPSNS